MRIKKMNWFVKIITFNWPSAITLAPFSIYIKEEHWFNERMIRHECIHWKQQLEMIAIGIIISAIAFMTFSFFEAYSWWLLGLLVFPLLFFYIWYFIEWLIKLIMPPTGAYKDISFEREAKNYHYDMFYLEERKPFAWFKYIKK